MKKTFKGKFIALRIDKNNISKQELLITTVYTVTEGYDTIIQLFFGQNLFNDNNITQNYLSNNNYNTKYTLNNVNNINEKSNAINDMYRLLLEAFRLNYKYIVIILSHDYGI